MDDTDVAVQGLRLPEDSLTEGTTELFLLVHAGHMASESLLCSKGLGAD